MSPRVPPEAAALLREATCVVVFTGAGMSAESGLDTYRDAVTGLWENVDPTAMASISAWNRDPDPMWAWYLWRARLSLEAQPNAGHRALATKRIPVVTQNIDNLHERGGSNNVVHLHGSLFEFRCATCGNPATQPDYPHTPLQRLEPPQCESCGGLVRPGVVWFGEALPAKQWQQAEDLISGCDLLIVVGTSGVVQPAASLPQLASRVLEISPQPTEYSPWADFWWEATAATALPALLSEQ